MKTMILLSTLALGGCAQFDAAVQDFNKPETQAALATVRSELAPIACLIAAQGGVKTVRYAASSTACVVLGGVAQ